MWSQLYTMLSEKQTVYLFRLNGVSISVANETLESNMGAITLQVRGRQNQKSRVHGKTAEKPYII